MDSKDSALRARLRLDLKSIVGLTPAGIGGWSWDKTHDFKVATEHAQRTISRKSATAEALVAALATPKRFY